MSNDSKQTVQATKISLKTIDIIRALDGARLTEISDNLDLAKSTVHRHLNTLEEHGYVVQEGNEYNIGLKFLHFGEYARNREGIYQPAEDQVLELANTTNQEVDFTVEEHGRLISLYHSVGQSQESGLQVGSYFSMHNTAAGKALLAEYSDERVDSIIDRWGLPAETENTITSKDELLADLNDVRDRGYSINDEELREGFRSVGIAIKYSDDRILGGLSVGGPTYRIKVDEDDDLINRLKSAARTLEEDIASGHHRKNNWWDQYSPIG